MSNEFMTIAEVVMPLLGMDGLPRHITKFELVGTGMGLMEVRCEFILEKQQYADMDNLLRPVFAKYQLVKMEASPDDSVPEPIRVEPAHKQTLEELLEVANGMKANVEKAIAERDREKLTATAE
jgi:hypothetical protein